MLASVAQSVSHQVAQSIVQRRIVITLNIALSIVSFGIWFELSATHSF
jgi:hypothetical protein